MLGKSTRFFHCLDPICIVVMCKKTGNVDENVMLEKISLEAIIFCTSILVFFCADHEVSLLAIRRVEKR